MTYLFALLISIAPQYSLNKWACDLVNSQPGDGVGCYDWCLERAAYMETTDNLIHDHTKVGDAYAKDGIIHLGNPWPSGVQNNRAELGLTDDYSHQLQNACAIVMHGGEY